LALATLGLVAKAAVPADTYTNQCYVVEADDLGGLTITLSYKEGRPQVEFEECEGGCWSPDISNVKVTPDTIQFDALESGPKGEMKVRYVSRWSDGVLLVTAPGHPEIPSQHLRKASNLNRRFDCQGER
jgi:hypothetical protein